MALAHLHPPTLDMAVRRLCTALTVDDRSGGHAETIERCIDAIVDLQKRNCALENRVANFESQMVDIRALANEVY